MSAALLPTEYPRLPAILRAVPRAPRAEFISRQLRAQEVLPPSVASRNSFKQDDAAKREFVDCAQMTAASLLTYIEPAHPDVPWKQLFERFVANPRLGVIPVVKGGRPLGIINRNSLIDKFHKSVQSTPLGNEACGVFLSGEPLLVEKNLPVEELSNFLAGADSRHFAEGFIITENGRYLGVACGQDLLRVLTQMQAEAARYANPLTLLPGHVPTDQHITRLLQSGTSFVACGCNIDNFRPYNETYSYRKGDEMIQLAARILNWACDPKRDFIGHVGGDDFVMLMQSRDWKARCETALRSFEQAASLLFEEAHLLAGGYHCEARDGTTRFHALTTLSIGAVKVAPSQFHSRHGVSTAMLDAKRMAKRAVGNSLFIEQRAASTSMGYAI